MRSKPSLERREWITDSRVEIVLAPRRGRGEADFDSVEATGFGDWPLVGWSQWSIGASRCEAMSRKGMCMSAGDDGVEIWYMAHMLFEWKLLAQYFQMPVERTICRKVVKVRIAVCKSVPVYGWNCEEVWAESKYHLNDGQSHAVETDECSRMG